MDMKETVVRLISILITFMIFLGALMLMRKYNVSWPIKIIVLVVLVVLIDFVKSKIFRR